MREQGLRVTRAPEAQSKGQRTPMHSPVLCASGSRIFDQWSSTYATLDIRFGARLCCSRRRARRRAIDSAADADGCLSGVWRRIVL
jgi:hypothetical protein